MTNRLWRVLVHPAARQLPFAVVAVAGSGAVLGAILSFPVAWLAGVDWSRAFPQPYRWPAHAAISGACYGVSAYAIAILPLEFLRPRLRSLPRLNILAHVMAPLLACIAGSWLAYSPLQHIVGRGRSTPLPENRLLAIAVFTAAITSVVLTAVRTASLERQLRERTLSEQAARAQTYALQAQIHPHFLFNTLSTIAALVEFDPAGAKEMIGTLAGLFRYTLSCSNREQVRLEDELAFVREYLAIEQARLGTRLRYEFFIDHEVRGVHLPGLTLQPLVENSIRHGIAQRIDGGIVRISVERKNAECHIRITNQAADDADPSELKPEIVFRGGHALANTRDRLELCYPGRASLMLTADTGNWVLATVIVPIAVRE